MSNYQKIVGPATVNLVAPSDNSIVNSPIILSCDSTLGAITINLPSIASLNTAAALGVKYVINDRALLAQTNNINIVCDAADKINNAASIAISQNGGSQIVQVTDLNDWEGLASLGGAQIVANTATADGSGTGTVANGNVFVNVTSAAGGNLIILPKPVPGMVIRLMVGANGYSLQSNDPATVGINGGIGAGKKSAVAANVYVELIASTTLNWIGRQYTSAGVQTPVAVAA